LLDAHEVPPAPPWTGPAEPDALAEPPAYEPLLGPLDDDRDHEPTDDDTGPDTVVVALHREAARRRHPAGQLPAVIDEPGELLPIAIVRRAIVELATQTAAVSNRLEGVERRIDDLAEQVFEAATQSDLIEVEARRARLAAEMARLTVQLRGEIDGGLQRLARELADVVAAQGSVDAAPLPPPLRLDDLMQLDTLPGDLIGRPGPFLATGTDPG
jgi:hypothetical protein